MMQGAKVKVALDVDALGDQIAEMSAHIDAAMHRLLTAIREFDGAAGWHVQGALSCAHWLAWRVGWDLRTARERVRVARKLAELPLVDEQLRRGAMSYAQARVIMRVATAITSSTGPTAEKRRCRISCCYALSTIRCCTKAAAGSKPTVPMAGIFSTSATGSSTRNQDAQHQPTLLRDVALWRYAMSMRRSPWRPTATHQNGPSKRSTTRGASTIWCEARRSSKRATPGPQALVNLRNDHRKCDQCAAFPGPCFDGRPPKIILPRLARGAQPRTLSLRHVKTIEVHHFGPGCNKVAHESRLGVGTCIDFDDRTQLTV